MEDITYEEFREAATGVDPIRFLKAMDRFIDPPKRRQWFSGTTEPAAPAIPELASEVMNRATLSISRLINYRFEIRGRRELPEEKAIEIRRYFHQLKKHQIELLFSIGDDVELISSLVMKSIDIRKTIRGFSPALRQASQLMAVLRERMARRPTTLLRLAGDDRKIQELNETVRDIAAYEQSRKKMLEKCGPDGNDPLYNGCRATLEALMEDVASLRLRVERHFAELKRGGKLLVRIASKGYSPFMKRSLDLLTRNHRLRTRDFRDRILRIRLEYYIAG